MAAVFVMLALLVSGCASSTPSAPPVSPPAPKAVERTPTAEHPHSFSNPEEVVVRHLSLDLAVDFEHRRIAGIAMAFIKNITGASQLVLDTRDLDIVRVTLGRERKPTTFHLGDEVPYLGRPLVIDIAPDTSIVRVEYVTSPNAEALQWLSPEQTAGKKHPFLYTQSETIYARTWVPCQDTPSVRITYDAVVRVPKGLMAVMSATNPSAPSKDGIYRFQMPQAIPSYLLALAVGDLEFRPFDSRSGIYAEPSVIDAAAWEFADTPKMIAAAEDLYGPYRWGRYDLLVLPPSFPYGGMENPRLTFVTPTVLAGDRSLVSLVAHELAHSWSGNLVTNATWNDFWLNEGFTDYFTSRIMEKLYGRDYSEMLATLDLASLRAEMADLDPRDTWLSLDLKGRDPEDGTTSVAYTKGYYFLRLCEETVGRERWDAFLRSWFDTFAFQSRTTADFVRYLDENLLANHPEWAAAIDVDRWVYGPGLPTNLPVPHSEEFAKVDAELARFFDGTAPTDLETSGWNSHQWVHFLRGLEGHVTSERMAELDSAFGFTKSHNSEVLNVWFARAIETWYEPAFPALATFLEGMGRRLYLVPLYTELAKTPEGMKLAKEIYATARPSYHAISQKTVDGILEQD